MITSIAVAMSLDAKLTRHDEPDIREWVSDEDQAFFRPLLAEHDVVVMGRGTYEVIRPNLQHNNLFRRIVLTRTPQHFDDQVVSEKLEFRNQSTTELLQQLNEDGVEKVLLVGGPQMLGEALRSRLVDYVYVTIEPRLFGRGMPFVDQIAIDCQLELLSHEQVNAQGTLILKYRVLEIIV